MIIIVLAFVLPFLTLYLTRKQSILQMILKTTGVTACYYLFVFLALPSLSMLRWKSSISWFDILDYWGAEVTIPLQIMLIPVIFVVLAILIVVQSRRGK